MKKKTRLRFSWTLSVEVKSLWIAAFVFLTVIGMQRAEKEKRDLWKALDGFILDRGTLCRASTVSLLCEKSSALGFGNHLRAPNIAGKTIWRLTSFLVSFSLSAAGCAVLIALCWEGKIIGKRPALTCGRISLWMSIAWIVPWWISKMMKCQIVDSLCASREFAVHNQSVTANDDSK